jgi:hypothetical protein
MVSNQEQGQCVHVFLLSDDMYLREYVSKAGPYDIYNEIHSKRYQARISKSFIASLDRL